MPRDLGSLTHERVDALDVQLGELQRQVENLSKHILQLAMLVDIVLNGYSAVIARLDTLENRKVPVSQFGGVH